MVSFRAIIREGERLASLAEVDRQDQIDQAFAAHRARQESKCQAKMGAGWDRALDGFASATVDHGAQGSAADVGGRDRALAGLRPAAADHGAQGGAADAHGWDRALAPLAGDAPNLDPDKKDDDEGESEERDRKPTRHPLDPRHRERRRRRRGHDGKPRSAALSAVDLLSSLWRSMFPAE